MWFKLRQRLISIVAVLIFFLTVVHLTRLSTFYRIRHVESLETNSSLAHPSQTPDRPNGLPELSHNVFNQQSKITLPLNQWLQNRGLLPRKTVLIVTIADSSYLRSLRSFQRRLSAWNYHKQMLVLCLDQICADDPELYNAYPGYIQDDENVMHAVGAVKVRKDYSSLYICNILIYIVYDEYRPR
jgi:hypothetical protein